ncbi:COG1470 family protein [Bordetella genomosp. 11]|nr:NEW3 domain-containing protein [Bordetella genomosp. 11]
MLSRLACVAALLASFGAFAQNARDIKGLYLLTDYPAITVQPGTTSTIDLRLRNFGLPPARLNLQVQDVPKGWTATLLGGGQPVGAAMAIADDTVSLQLRLAVPADAGTQPHTFTVVADGSGQHVTLPVEVMLSKQLPAKLTLDTPLPSIKGGARSSFDYQFTVKNDSGKDLNVALDAKTPQYFDATFTEGYGSQQISTLPIKAGQSKDVKLSVRPPGSAKPGDYPIGVTASADGVQASSALQLQITGQPALHIAGRDGLMSGSAEAGKTSTLPVIVANDGGADADAVQLSAQAPSGWRVDFEPKTIPHVAAGQQVEVQAHITPSPRSLAGDYMATLNANAGSQSATGEFRVTVSTSSLWGIIGAVIIAVALLILVGAVARFGRR